MVVNKEEDSEWSIIVQDKAEDKYVGSIIIPVFEY